MNDDPIIYRRPGAKLIGIKRRFVPLWLFRRLFVPIVRYRWLRWILVETYPK